ncbi:NAD-dependent epimerase/dehydratase family protein [Candidatus Dojkabacteria bacterium]|jgi:UDP-sulfoquinovose synthase|nr:NAD-dependent epimerase/dehydratase family protein [Candidatus Dojkabacteria bacterium]
MKVIILGAEGYLGKALSISLSGKHELLRVDNKSREMNVAEIGSKSLTPEKEIEYLHFNICDYDKLKAAITEFEPNVIIHLAEQPSAPFSMIDALHAADTQQNNVIGSLNLLWAVKEVNPEIQIIKLGTAGEYPDWLYNGMTIPEDARIKVEYQSKLWEIPTPRYAGSFYHFSKLFDSYNIDYACKIWGLNVTDINQGVVYGHIDGIRFDYDEYFGTVVNRFVVQSIAGVPLTIYGSGGQTRGYINIQNVIDAIELIMKNPANGYRIIHQLTEELSVGDIASLVQKITGCDVQSIPNPRFEMDSNKFTFEAKLLKKFGLKARKMEDELPDMIKSISRYKDSIKKKVIMPKTKWV